MTEQPKRPSGAVPHPDHDGWFHWPGIPADSFAGRTGPLLFRPVEPGKAMTRMLPDETHQNYGGSIHGGAVMSFIDMSLFAGGRCAGMAEGHYVTLDCHTRFLNRGRVGKPLTGHVTLVRQTPGGLVFLAGFLEQDGEPCYDFTGTLKRVKAPNGPSAGGDDDGPRR